MCNLWYQSELNSQLCYRMNDETAITQFGILYISCVYVCVLSNFSSLIYLWLCNWPNAILSFATILSLFINCKQPQRVLPITHSFYKYNMYCTRYKNLIYRDRRKTRFFLQMSHFFRKYTIFPYNRKFQRKKNENRLNLWIANFRTSEKIAIVLH